MQLNAASWGVSAALATTDQNPSLAGPSFEGLRGLAEDAVDPAQQKKVGFRV